MARFQSAFVGIAWVGTFMVSLMVAGTAVAEPPPSDPLAAIRTALAARDLETAETKLAEAAEMKKDKSFVAELARLQTLFQYSAEFWKSVSQGAGTLKATEELVVGKTITSVVEFTGNVLILRVNGKNVRYDVKSLPAKVAMTLAERVMKPNDANSKAIIGAFLLTDGKGSRDVAARYLKEAQQGGVDVSELMPELDITPTIVFDIPELTPLMRRILTPASWTLLQTDGGKMTRQELGESGKLNENGRLVITLADSVTAPAQVVLGRRLAANFGCRVLLENESTGTRFGLFSSTDAGESFSVELPAGLVKVEIARQGDAFKCQVNGAMGKFEPSGKTRTRMPGMLGIEMPAGQSATILWFELIER